MTYIGTRRVLYATSQYLPATQALIARFTTPPTQQRASLINSLIGTLRSAGIWGNLDCFCMLAAATSQAAQLNWVQNKFNLTPVNGPTFTVDRGYQGDGVSSYLNINGAPNQFTYFQQNNGLLGSWSIIAGTGFSIGRPTSGSSTLLTPTNGGSTFLGRINGNLLSLGNVTSLGLSVAQRTDSNNGEAFRNGASIGTGTGSSGAPDSTALTLGRIGSVYATDQFGHMSIGASLTSTQQLAYYNAVYTYLHAIGAV